MSVKNILLFLVLMTILPASIGGYIHYTSAKEQKLKEADKEAKSILQSVAIRYDEFFDKYNKISKTLGGIEALKQALVFRNEITLGQANMILDHFKKTLNVSVCYLMDGNGKTIASSNRNMANSFVGKNYGFRPYFKDAAQGNAGIYMALGVTSQKRGAYFSQPLYLVDDAIPSGVLVIKVSAEVLEKDLKKSFENGVVLFVDPDGVVFMSNREDWRYRTLWELSSQRVSEILKTRQFGKKPLKWTGLKRKGKNHAFDRAGTQYRIYKIGIHGYPGWEIVFLEDIQSIYKKVSGPLFRTVGVSVMVFIILLVLTAFYLYKNANDQISRQQKMEAALQESEEKFRSVSQTATEAIISADNKGHIVFWNKAAKNMFGYTPQEVLGQDITIIVPERYKGAHINGFRGHVSRGESKIIGETVGVVGLGKDGSEIPMELSLATWKVKKETFYTAIIRDITERKEMERDREKLIEDLRDALKKVKTLSGFLPICANCKNIRNDKGYWDKIETYISKHTDADFSHGICPECAKQLYPDYADDETNE